MIRIVLLVAFVILFFWTIDIYLYATKLARDEARRFEALVQDGRIESAYIVVLVDRTLSIDSQFFQYEKDVVTGTIIPTVSPDDTLHVYTIDGAFNASNVICADPIPVLLPNARRSLEEDLRKPTWTTYQIGQVRPMTSEADSVKRACVDRVKQIVQTNVNCHQHPCHPLCRTDFYPSFRAAEHEFIDKRNAKDDRKTWLIILSDFVQDVSPNQCPVCFTPGDENDFQDVNVVFVYPPSNTFNFDLLTRWKDYFHGQQQQAVSVLAADKTIFPLRDNALLAVADQPALHTTMDLFIPMFLQELKILAVAALLAIALIYGINRFMIRQNPNQGG